MHNVSLEKLETLVFSTSNQGLSRRVVVDSSAAVAFLVNARSLRRFLQSHQRLEFVFRGLEVTVRDSADITFHVDFSLRYRIRFPKDVSASFSVKKRFAEVNSALLRSYLLYLLLLLLHLVVSLWLLVLGFRVLDDVVSVSDRISQLEHAKSLRRDESSQAQPSRKRIHGQPVGRYGGGWPGSPNRS